MSDANAPPPPRIASLDALRGFDMFWIVGGKSALVALAAAFGLAGVERVLLHQTDHAPWHGFRAYDLIFPLFLFLAGASTELSFASRRARGKDRRALFLYALRRGLALVLLGAIYNGLLSLDFERQRYASVLGRIGLAWMAAAWIALVAGPRGRALAVLAILLAYWAMMALVPVPGVGAGELAQGRNLADWLDQRFLPGRLYAGDHDPEGLLSTFPAIATALLGMLAGAWLFGGGPRRAPSELRARSSADALIRPGALAIASLALLGAGHLFGLAFPVNKKLWTSSFVLVAAGWSGLLLAVFHVVFDVARAPRTARALAVIGAHALVAYIAARFVDFPALAKLLLGRAVERGLLHDAALPVAALALLWGALYLYDRARRRRARRRLTGAGSAAP